MSAPPPKPKSKVSQHKPGRPKKRGRPSKLNKALTEKICNFIKMGSYIEVAAQANGIDRTTFTAWMHRGAKAIEAKSKNPIEKRYIRFVKCIHKATAEAEIMDLEKIDMASDTDWKAAAWKLERRYTRWGAKDQLKITDATPAEEGDELDQLGLSLEVRVQILEAIKKKELELAEKAKQQKLLPPPKQEAIDVEFEVKKNEPDPVQDPKSGTKTKVRKRKVPDDPKS